MIIIIQYNNNDNNNKNDNNNNKHNAELQRADPSTKVTGKFITRGRIFPQNAQNAFSLFSSF